MPLTQYTFFCPKKSDEILNSHRQSAQQNFQCHRIHDFSHAQGFVLCAPVFTRSFFISEVKKLGILNLGGKKSATSNKKNYPHVEEI